MEDYALIVTVIIITIKRTIITSTAVTVLLFFYCLPEFCRYSHEDLQRTTQLSRELKNGDDFFT